jgi:hypothetical protein
VQLAKEESVTAVQRAFRTQFRLEPPSRVSIYERLIQDIWAERVHLQGKSLQAKIRTERLQTPAFANAPFLLQFLTPGVTLPTRLHRVLGVLSCRVRGRWGVAYSNSTYTPSYVMLWHRGKFTFFTGRNTGATASTQTDHAWAGWTNMYLQSSYVVNFITSLCVFTVVQFIPSQNNLLCT